MDFEWDPAKARSNFSKHGISFSDVETAFYDQHAISMPDPGASTEERFILVGMDAVGAIVVVIYTYRGNSIRIISARRAPSQSERVMSKEYDFSKGKRGPVVKSTGKTRITIYLDDDIIAAFRKKGDELGRGYQTLINDALRGVLSESESVVDAKTLRRIIREELIKVG